MAKKFHQKYPELNLGQETLKLPGDHIYSHPPSFVEHLSVGGLFAPSVWFLKQGHKIEKVFRKLNLDGNLKKIPGIVKRGVDILQKQIHNLPVEILKAIYKERVIVEVKFQNIKILNEKHFYSKRNCTERSYQARKTCKRL